MNPTDIIEGNVFEDTGVAILARIRSLATGALITKASLSSIVCKVYDMTGPTLVATRTPVINDTVYDTLQTTHTGWTDADGGYNFLDVVEATNFPLGGRTYRLEYVFTPVSGQPFAMVAEIYSEEMHGS